MYVNRAISITQRLSLLRSGKPKHNGEENSYNLEMGMWST